MLLIHLTIGLKNQPKADRWPIIELNPLRQRLTNPPVTIAIQPEWIASKSIKHPLCLCLSPEVFAVTV